MSSAVFMLFCHVLKCVLWTRKTSLSSLSQLAFNFGCFFLCRFQTVVWSCAIRTPRHLDFLLIWPFLIVFSSSSQPGPWVAKGTVWPGGGPGHRGLLALFCGGRACPLGSLGVSGLCRPFTTQNSGLLTPSSCRPPRHAQRRVCSPLPTRLSLSRDTAAVLPEVKNLPNFKSGKDMTGALSVTTH